MLKLLSITLRNFMSYGNVPTTIDLTSQGSTLIQGFNVDASSNGSASNGSGKSSMLLALMFALYDKTTSSVNKDGLVNLINGKQMEVTVTFEVKGKFYKVYRARKMKAGAAGNYVKVYERSGDINFTDDDEITSTTANEDIVSRIGIPFELFSRIVVYSGDSIPFLSLPRKHPTQPCQQSFVEELFDISTLTRKAEVLKETVKQHEIDLNLAKSRIDLLERQRAHHERQVVEARARIDAWEDERIAKIARLNQQAEQLANVDTDEQKLVLEALAEVKDAIEQCKSELLAAEQAKRDAATKVRTLQSELDHLTSGTCPYCQQAYHDNEVKREEIQTTLTELKERLQTATEAAAHWSSVFEQLKTTRGELQSAALFSSLEELLSSKYKRTEIDTAVSSLEQEVNPYIAVLESLEQQQPEQPNYDQVNFLTDQIEHEQFLIRLLTKNDSFIRKAVLNKNLPYLNTRLNYYLRRLDLPHMVTFTEELTPSISRFGSEFDFDNLSTGQKARVNLALSLAFRDVLQDLHQKVNLFWIDETLDRGLDPTGVISAAKVIKEEARKNGTCLFVVSHREEIASSFDKKLLVVYEGGFSRAYQTPDEIAEARTRLRLDS